jgi:hypothetical protein
MRGALLLALLALGVSGAGASCGTACLSPKIASNAVASSPVLIETTFSGPFAAFAGVATGYAISYGICYVVGCNYRNVTTNFTTANAGQNDVVYTVTFFNLPGSSNITAFPAALSAALPSLSPATVGTIAYGISFTQGGALSTLTGVYPVPYLNSALPPASPPPAAASPPPAVVAASPPPPPMPSPPPPPSSPVTRSTELPRES